VHNPVIITVIDASMHKSLSYQPLSSNILEILYTDNTIICQNSD
jgi:hypothetical protein